MISQDMISDEHFNALSLEAQNIFVRMLSVSDDCGVVPASAYRLNVLINTPNKLRNKMGALIAELVDAGMGHLFDFKDEKYFAFKPGSFADYQSYILKKATKSEYLRIPKDEFETLSKNFPELPRNSSRPNESALSTVESRKQKVESKKQKATWIGEALIIPPEMREDLNAEFGREVVDAQIPKMSLWLRHNKPKKDYNRFIFNWLNNSHTQTPPTRVDETPGKFRRRTGTEEMTPLSEVKIHCTSCGKDVPVDHDCDMSQIPKHLR